MLNIENKNICQTIYNTLSNSEQMVEKKIANCQASVGFV